VKLNLYQKFLLGYLLFGVLGFILIVIFSGHITEQYLVDKKSDSLYKEALTISETCNSLYTGSMMDINDITPQLGNLSTWTSSDIWIINKYGTVIYDSCGEHGETVLKDFNPAELTGGQNYSIGTYYGSYSSARLSVTAPITVQYSIRGYVVIHLDMSLVLEEKEDILNLIYGSCVMIFILSLILLLVFQIVVYRPIAKIRKAADAYATGDLKYQCEVHSSDELGYLAATLNYMAMELSNTEDYQKQFISNISHDFRSPLTSIQGYLVAILDGTIPPERYEKYLNIVIQETKRLHKLTEGLLTLNKLEGKSTNLNLGNFDINRVIKDTCATFEVGCLEKNITLDLTFSEKSLMVYADMGKIQQVMYNLIDNAIKFSNQDSTIWIETYDKNDKVFVSVKDAGCGIAKDKIAKIWERFYKIDSSRGRDKKGTGLGLAITKDIITAHRQNIDVISTEGVGTEFIFTLKLSESNDSMKK
jgi:signal transduction histidine kinase